jgi:hypothetical protein
LNWEKSSITWSFSSTVACHSFSIMRTLIEATSQIYMT